MDITEQPLSENQAVIRTNMRNIIKRVRAIYVEADNLVAQLKSGIENEKVKAACGTEYEAFKEAIEQL